MKGHAPLAPLLAVAAGIATFSLMDMFMKAASLEIGVYPVLVLRNALGTLMVLPLWLRCAGTWPSRPALRLHVFRSATVAAMAALFFWGLVRVPMAEAIAISFIAPLLALYFASVFLGERIAPGAIFASVFGLLGVCVIALGRLSEPATGTHSLAGMAAILLSAVFYAINLVIQRRQAQLASPFEVAFFQNLFVLVILLAALPALWLLPPGTLSPLILPHAGVAGQIAAAAALTVVSLVLLTWGYARAEAQALLPLEYTGFAWAALFGWLQFGEAVTLATLAGTVLIVIGSSIAARGAARGAVKDAPPP